MKKHTYHRLFYLTGALVSMAIAESSFFPATKYVFSSLTAGHIILLLISAPLSVLAMRERPEAKGGLAFHISRRLSAMPWINWLIGVGVLWLWQIPGILDTLLAWDGPGHHRHLHLVSFLHSGSLLLAGILFCWPLAGPYLAHRLSPPESLLYLTSAWVGGTLLAYLIEFTSPGHYGGGGTVITHKDQQIGGLILWVPCCVLYFSGGVYLLREWMGRELWHSNEFYRRGKRARTRINPERPQAEPDYLGHNGVIIPHHSPQ